MRIEVMDRNDNAPKWKTSTNDQLLLELPDEAQPGHRLTKLEAEDVDNGPEGKVLFLLDSDPSGAFDLDPDSGELLFARYLMDVQYFNASTCQGNTIPEGQYRCLACCTRSG